MHIHKVSIKNFRLLSNADLVLEDQTTLIVGRNNSGKTSFYEAIRRFLDDQNPKFQIEDFSNTSYNQFFEALAAKIDGRPDNEVRELVPHIELRLLFRYDPNSLSLGALSDFIVDLNPECNETLVVARYELKDGGIKSLFADFSTNVLTDNDRIAFFQTLRQRVPALFTTGIWAEDPNDETNRKLMTTPSLRSLLRTGFVNAQRGLDDDTSRDSDVLAKILESLFSAAKSPTAGEEERLIAQALQEAVQGIQDTIQGGFREELKKLMPTLRDFGYPGLDGTELETETTLDVERLLSRHTKVRYPGHHGILLPESYTGLGIRNLIYILLRIVSFHRNFCAEPSAPGVHLVFIEEPEAHLHPQMQEVFIRQISNIADQLSNAEGTSLPWPVQFIVSTHSSHIANAVRFESIRYFIPKSDNGVRHTRIKDLHQGLCDTPEEHKRFIHQYLTLTRCDLFFADKAVLIEGTSERLLLPVIIDKLETAIPGEPKLSSQYVTTMEVGGAYAHIFFTLLDFLELRTLIITDLDSVAEDGKACPVHKGSATSNACIKSWFGNSTCSLTDILDSGEDAKVDNLRRIAFQRPEVKDGPCGRTFEDAFMLANAEFFNIEGVTADEQEFYAWKKVANIKKKSEFALNHAINQTDWSPPGYILDGLRWLAQGENTVDGSANNQAVDFVESVDAEVAQDD